MIVSFIERFIAGAVLRTCTGNRSATPTQMWRFFYALSMFLAGLGTPADLFQLIIHIH